MIRLVERFHIGDDTYLLTDASQRSNFEAYVTNNRYPWQKNSNIVFIGDSWTYGSGASDNAHRFSTLLADDLSMAENNFGVGASGFCIPDNTFLDQVNTANSQMTSTIKQNTRIVIVYGGVNDIRHINDYDITFTKYWNAIQTLAGRINVVFPNATTFFAFNTRCDAFTDTEYNYITWAAQGKLFRNNVAQFAFLTNSPCVINGLTSCYQNDYLHPNDAGHSTIAGYLANCIRGGCQDIKYYASDVTLNSLAGWTSHMHLMRENYWIKCTGGQISFTSAITVDTKIGELAETMFRPKFNIYQPAFYGDALAGYFCITSNGNVYYLPSVTNAESIYVAPFAYMFGQYG